MTLIPVTPLTSLAKPTFLNPNPMTTKTTISTIPKPMCWDIPSHAKAVSIQNPSFNPLAKSPVVSALVVETSEARHVPIDAPI